MSTTHDVTVRQNDSDDMFRGLASAEGQILPFPIDFDGRAYDTLALPYKRVICFYRAKHLHA